MLTSERIGETSSTPRRAQKRLFTAGSSSKRNLFRETRTSSPGGGNSGDESDLGPMSPLALSDATPSSANHSPARLCDSPLAGRYTVPPVSLGSSDLTLWERGVRDEDQDRVDAALTSPFSILKMLTNSARYSRRPNLCPFSPEQTSSRRIGDSLNEKAPASPKQLDPYSTLPQTITETPKKKFGREIQNESIFESDVAETPRKDSPVKRLITPLGSVSKEASLPRLHHRKSLSTMAFHGNFSPMDGKENMLKRTASDATVQSLLKLYKSEECPCIPKARAALFQERKAEFKLSTKSFYSSPPFAFKALQTASSADKNDTRRGQKRHSVPAKCSRGRPTKKRRYGEINAGICHGVKRPKLKRHESHRDTFKKEEIHNKEPAPSLIPIRNNLGSIDINNRSQNVHNSSADANGKAFHTSCVASSRKSSTNMSPQVDPGKKFFKTNRTITRNCVATVTINDAIKLQVSNGKICNTNNLPNDDPTDAIRIDESNVTSILKVLKDDWANDDYDTLESLTAKQQNAISPLKSSFIPHSMAMSPASELSSMTSVMNIKDSGGPAIKHDGVLTELYTNSVDQNKTIQFYPVFSKDHGGDKHPTGTSKKLGRGVKRPSVWQLQAKSAKKDHRQYQLDFGQKQFGATQCPQCNVVYQIGDPDDEIAHKNYHNSIKILKFPGWKQERVVGTHPCTSSRILLVEPGDPKHCWKKVSEILEVIDRDLGLADAKLSDYRKNKIYLYIRDKEVVGVLAAEYVNTGYRMLPDLADLDCCSLEGSTVKCGVKVVWTTARLRRQGIATKLMNVLRSNFYFGYVLSLDDIAFSMPTAGGKAFAAKYTNTRCFKIYH